MTKVVARHGMERILQDKKGFFWWMNDVHFKTVDECRADIDFAYLEHFAEYTYDEESTNQWWKK